MTNVPIVPAVPTPARRPNFRQKRLAATVQEILAPALLDAGQLSDELQGQSLIVTGVAVSPNLHDAKIFLRRRPHPMHHYAGKNLVTALLKLKRL